MTKRNLCLHSTCVYYILNICILDNTQQATNERARYLPNETDDGSNEPRERAGVIGDGRHDLSVTVRAHCLDGVLAILLHHGRRVHRLDDHCRPSWT